MIDVHFLSPYLLCEQKLMQKELKFMNFFPLSFTASRIRYEITSGNIGGAFAVKNMTGAIYVAGALDYETRKRVSIECVCVSLTISSKYFLLFFLFHQRFE
jgi:hypothetical protein